MFSPHSRSESGCKQICWTISHVSDRSVAVLAEDETQYCSRLHIFRASFWYLSLPPTFWRYVYNVCWQCSFKIIAQPGVPRDTFLIRQLEDKNDCQNMSERRPACLLGPPSFLCSCLCKQGQGLLYLQGRLITPKSFHPYVKSAGSTVQYSDCRVQCAHLVWCHGTVGNGGLDDICPNLGNVLWRRVDGCVALCFVKLYENIPLHNRYRKTLQKPWVLCLPERLHAMVAFDVLKRVEHIIFKTELEKGCKRWKRSLPNISKDVVSRQKGYQKVKYTDGQVRTISPWMVPWVLPLLHTVLGIWLSVRDSLRLLGFPCRSLICGCSNKIQTPKLQSSLNHISNLHISQQGSTAFRLFD